MSKPQLHYLLGYLRMEEHQYATALPEFVKAAQLDPDYINAWKQISEIGQNFQLTPDIRDDSIFNLIRLDPGSRHVTSNTRNVRQLAKLWTTVESTGKSLLPPPLSLLPLQVDDTSSGTTYDAGDQTDLVHSPCQAVLQNDVINSIITNLR